MAKIGDYYSLEIKKMLEQKLSVKYIASKIGVSTQAVYSFIKKNNLKTSYLRVSFDEVYKGIPYRVYLKEKHISPTTIRRIMRERLLTLPEAIEEAEKKKSKYQYNGVALWQLAKERGININTFWTRMRKGLPVEEILKDVVRKHNPLNKTLKSLINKLNKGEPQGNMLFNLLIGATNGIKIQYKTKNDVKKFLKSITKDFTEKEFEDFWNYFVEHDSYSLGNVWNDYTSLKTKRELWKIGEFMEKTNE